MKNAKKANSETITKWKVFMRKASEFQYRKNY